MGIQVGKFRSPELDIWDWCSEEKYRLKTEIWETLNDEVVRTPDEEETM